MNWLRALAYRALQSTIFFVVRDFRPGKRDPHKPARYVAIEPERLCDLLKGRFDTTIDDLRDSLSSMVRQSGGALLWPLRDERGYRARHEPYRKR